MPTTVKSNRWSQIVAWAAASLFILGVFLSQVGAWTGPILGVWFVGTQKPRRGFLWMLAFAYVPSLLFGWRNFPLTSPEQAFKYLAWKLFVAVLGVLPFTFHRLVSPRLPGFLSTLPLPLAAIAIPALAMALHSGAAYMIGPVHLPHLLVCGDGRLVVEPGIARHNLRLRRRLYRCRSFRTPPPFRLCLTVDQSPRWRNIFLDLPRRSPVPERLGALPSDKTYTLGKPAADCGDAAKPIYRRTIARGQRQGP